MFSSFFLPYFSFCVSYIAYKTVPMMVSPKMSLLCSRVLKAWTNEVIIIMEIILIIEIIVKHEPLI